jgi:hypothetical protein
MALTRVPYLATVYIVSLCSAEQRHNHRVSWSYQGYLKVYDSYRTFNVRMQSCFCAQALRHEIVCESRYILDISTS